jgi:hypothetical protein
MGVSVQLWGAAPMVETYHLINILRVPSGKSLAKNAGTRPEAVIRGAEENGGQ